MSKKTQKLTDLAPIAVASYGALRVARLTSDTGPLTKVFSLAKDGTLQKETAAMLSRGSIENLELADFDEFLKVLPELQCNQALTYGISRQGSGLVCSAERWGELGNPSGMWPRNRDNFCWPSGGGILMLDYDPHRNSDPLGREALLKCLYSVVPALQDAAHCWWPSASSCLVNKVTGEELSAVRGQRIYVWVANAEDIPRSGKALADRLWLAGHGRYDVSKSGSLLSRTLVDTAVWQPERLDFAAGAKCEAPLRQDRGAPARFGGDSPLDTRLVTDLTETEKSRLGQLEVEARAAVSHVVAANKTTWIAERAATLQTKRELDEGTARKVAQKAVESRQLLSDFILVAEDGTEVSVGEILNNRDQWHESRFHDPLEPEYPDDRITYANLAPGIAPYLYSHAHGGCRYALHRAAETITLSVGGSMEATEQTVALMCKDGTYFKRAGSVITVGENGEVQTLGRYALKQQLERNIRFEKPDGRTKGMKPSDCPDEIVHRILDSVSSWPLPTVNGIVQHPTMTATGRLLVKQGYDQESGLLLVRRDVRSWPHIPENPTEAQVLDALRRLWEPVSLFPYADAISRGIALAAMLTAVVRRGLRTAPAFLYAAPSAGAGKTLLAECVVALAGGAPPQTLPAKGPEIDKVLVSVLRMGRGALFFDNVTGTVNSKELNAMLTAPVYDGRILGESQMTGGLPTNTLVVLTGNNARPVGDTCRRMLVATIDPKMEHPFLREFEFNPRERVLASRMELIASALTILRGWIASGGEAEGEGELASFEEWDRLVRQAVIWVGNLERKALGGKAIGFDDPTANITEQCAADDENEALAELLELWMSEYHGKGFKAAELYSALAGMRNGYMGSAAAAILGPGLFSLLPDARSALVLSRWLRQQKGRVARGLRIEGVEDKSTNTTIWRVARVMG